MRIFTTLASAFTIVSWLLSSAAFELLTPCLGLRHSPRRYYLHSWIMMPAEKPSVVGKRIPDEVLEAPLTNQDGEATTLKEILASLDPKYHGIAMFMFPAVGTPHCSKQACGFQTFRQDFLRQGYDVYGLTTYSDRAKVWCQRHNLGYPILGTKDWALVKYLGCTYFRFLINRSHLVISRDAVVKALEVGVKAEMSSRSLLDIIRRF